MNEKKIRFLLHHADAETAMQIAERWPFPDPSPRARSAGSHHTGEDADAETETASGVAVTAQHAPAWRYAATAAAVMLLLGGSAGGLLLTQRLHTDAPVPSAEEQSSESSGSEPDTGPLPVIVPGKDEEPVDSAVPETAESSSEETEAFSQESSQPDTNAAESSAASEKPTVPAMDTAAEATAETAAPTDAVKETAAPTEAVTEAPKKGERITLAEAIKICSESANAWEAAETIRMRYDPDAHYGSGIDYQDFYLDDAGNEKITVDSNGGGNVYYTNRSMGAGEHWLLASNRSSFADDFVKYRSTVYDLQWRDTVQLFNWQRLELNKTDSALTEEQKAQLRALEEEESALWTTTYIRRRMEIIGALSPDAPHLTYEKTEKICAACETPEQAMQIILDSYVPDYDWGSGMTYYNYSLDADGKATISLVVGSSVIYWENFADPGNRNMRDFFQ